MIELFGFELGTIFQGGTLAALLALIAIVARVYILGMPERGRVANEGKAAAAKELAEHYKAWREEVQAIKNDTQMVMAEQVKCNKALADAHAINRHNETQMSAMLFLIRLLIRELERLTPDSVIVQQAKATLEHLGHASLDIHKSSALHAAEETVEVAKATVREVKQAEEDK